MFLRLNVNRENREPFLMEFQCLYLQSIRLYTIILHWKMRSILSRQFLYLNWQDLFTATNLFEFNRKNEAATKRQSNRKLNVNASRICDLTNFGPRIYMYVIEINFFGSSHRNENSISVYYTIAEKKNIQQNHTIAIRLCGASSNANKKKKIEFIVCRLAFVFVWRYFRMIFFFPFGVSCCCRYRKFPFYTRRFCLCIFRAVNTVVPSLSNFFFSTHSLRSTEWHSATALQTEI